MLYEPGYITNCFSTTLSRNNYLTIGR